jgi:hypothetical protein
VGSLRDAHRAGVGVRFDSISSRPQINRSPVSGGQQRGVKATVKFITREWRQLRESIRMSGARDDRRTKSSACISLPWSV